jgi:hypothetical protein
MVTTLSHEGLFLEGVLLNLRSVDFPAEHHTQSSDPAGVVAFNDLKVGSYILRAQTLDSGEHSYRTAHVDIEPGVTTNTRIQSEPTSATVSGTLIDISGIPVAGASIQLKMGQETTRKATSRADGSFSFKGLHAGEFFIKASRQELPIFGNEPALNIISTLRSPSLHLSIGEHIQLGDLAVQLKESPSITLHVIGDDPLLYEELSVHQTNSTRGHKPTNSDPVYGYSGNQRVGSFRLRRPKAGKDCKVYIRHGTIFLGTVMINSDSPAAIDFHL